MATGTGHADCGFLTGSWFGVPLCSLCSFASVPLKLLASPASGQLMRHKLVFELDPEFSS